MECCFVRTELCRHLHGHIRSHAACSLQPRCQCRRASIQSRTSHQSPPPAIPNAVCSCPTSSEGEASPVQARSPPSRWNRIRSCIVVPHPVPVKPARYLALHEHDPIWDGNHWHGSLSCNRNGYRLVLRREICHLIQFRHELARFTGKIKDTTNRFIYFTCCEIILCKMYF